MRRLVTASAILALLACAPAAQGAKLSIQATTKTATFTAAAGEANRLTVSQSGSTLTFDDPSMTSLSLSMVNVGCNVRHSSTSVECALPSPDFRLQLDLGDRDDRLTVHSSLPVRATGGAGNDTLAGGGGVDDISGGDGDDVIRTRDLVRDVVACGPGADTPEHDPEDVLAADCEGIVATLAPTALLPTTTRTGTTTPAETFGTSGSAITGEATGDVASEPAPPLTGVPIAGLPDPRPGRDLALGVKEGEALVRLPGASSYIPVQAGRRLPVGSSIDARRGVVSLVAARNLRGARQAADFTGAVFRISQRRAARMTTVLTLRGGDFSSCRRSGGPTARAAQAPRSTPVRRLWGSGHGRFKTRGRTAAATVRGTIWSVTDTCAGTTTRVERGLVAVRDLVRARTRLVRAGQSYLVRPAR